jgi:hypothetical protein
LGWPPKGLGVPEASHLAPQPGLRIRQLAEMPANYQTGLLADSSGISIGRPINLLNQALCGAHVIEVPECFLQRLQSLHQGVDLARVEQAAKEFGNIPKLLERYADAVAVFPRAIGKALALLSCLTPAPLDKSRRYVGNGSK